jgi:hypothetical protein
VVVDGARLLKVGLSIGRVHHLLRPPSDLVVERHQAVWLEPARHVRVALLFEGGEARLPQAGLDVLAARRVEAHGDGEALRRRVLDAEVQDAVAVPRRLNLVGVWGLDL